MRIKRFGLIALLWILVALHGAKTPGSFFLWSVCVLFFLGSQFRSITAGLRLRRYGKEAGLALALLLSYACSRNTSTSFYLTIQLLIFLLLWIAIKANPSLLPETPLWMGNLIFLGLWDLGITLVQVIQWNGAHAYGLFPINPIFNATWITGLGLFFVAYAVAQKKWGSYWKEGALGLIFCLTCILLPARSALIGLFIGALYLVRRLMTARIVMGGLVLLTLLAACLPNQIIYKRLRLNEKNPRLQIWTVAFEGAKDYPFTGWGLGNFEMAYQRYAFPFETDPIRYARTTEFAHNEFLQILTEVGWPAFLLLILGLYQTLSRPITVRQQQLPAKALLIVLLIVAVYNMIWHVPLFIYLTLLSLGLINYPEPVQSSSTRQPHLWVRTGFALLLVILGISTTWCAVRERWKAQKKWDAILSWNPKDADVWNEKAQDGPDPQQKIMSYGQAVTLSPENPYYRESFARALEAIHKPELYSLALEHYRAALSLAPSRAPNALALGRIYFIQGRPEAALPWFQKALSIEPTYWECDLWIARCLALRGQKGRAVSVLRNLRRRHAEYLAWREKVLLDLGPQPSPTAYQTSIIAYDDRVVSQEIRRLTSKHVRGLPFIQPVESV